MSTDAPTLADLRDRLDIVEICTLTHWLIDHRQFDSLDAVLHDVVSMPTLEEITTDPTFEAATYIGRFQRSREQIAEGIRSFLAGMTTQHLIAGHNVVLRGDSATCRAHSINMHISEADPDSIVVHGNDYQFDLIRTPAGWRVNGWLSWIRWSRGDASHHDVATKQRKWVDAIEAR